MNTSYVRVPVSVTNDFVTVTPARDCAVVTFLIIFHCGMAHKTVYQLTSRTSRKQHEGSRKQQ
jgi:hypothetical protein